MATQKKESEPEKKYARHSKQRRSGEDKDGVAAVRQKLTLDLKNQADRLKEAILGNEEEPVKPWNMRKKRAECKASIALKSHDHDDVDKNKPNCSSPAMTDIGVINLPKLRSNSDHKVERAKFHVELSKKEIDDDFMEILGSHPPRRPNKRAKVVQKKLDDIFPGLWLTEVNADLYKVVEVNEKVRPSEKGTKKRKGSPSTKGKGKDK